MNPQKKSLKPLVVEKTLNAPQEKVWEALTSRQAMKKWSFDVLQFKPQVGCEFEFAAGKGGIKYVHLCRVMEVMRPRKLSYTWRYQGYEGDSLVTFELFVQGKKTRLKLTHTGLETLPKLAKFARKNFEMGWTFIIGTSLKNFVEVPPDRKIEISRLVDATPERVWEAWTNPKQVALWWGPKGFRTTIRKMDVRPGGTWEHTMHGPDGTDYPNKSVFIEVFKPHRIVYSNTGGKKGEGTHFESIWTFEAVGRKTKVTIRMVFATAEERDRVVKVYGAIEGGKQTLGRLDLFLRERKKA